MKRIKVLPIVQSLKYATYLVRVNRFADAVDHIEGATFIAEPDDEGHFAVTLEEGVDAGERIGMKALAWHIGLKLSEEGE